MKPQRRADGRLVYCGFVFCAREAAWRSGRRQGGSLLRHTGYAGIESASAKTPVLSGPFTVFGGKADGKNPVPSLS